MIEAFTMAGARANFLEDETGSLEVGKSADLVVLREDLLELPAERIHEAAVELTLFRGRPAFAAGPFEGLAAPRGPKGSAADGLNRRSPIERRAGPQGSAADGIDRGAALMSDERARRAPPPTA